jgi:hypothetical protein
VIELKMRFTGKIALRVYGVTAFQQFGILKAA